METPIESSDEEKRSDKFFEKHRPKLRDKNDIKISIDELERKLEKCYQLYGKIYGQSALSKLRDSLKKDLDNKATKSGEQKSMDSGQTSETVDPGATSDPQ